ncbi:hypothetical protein B7494_g8513 [Chlorociboria aeruginascens]|nr:hypothetical protein B7494_g8513 [Chlorociboria aeruginascens]
MGTSKGSKRYQTRAWVSRPGQTYKTPVRCRFFDAYDQQYPDKSTSKICRDINISSPTGRRWLRQRQELGSPAYRRTRPLSKNLGRPPIISAEQCHMLISPSKNPVRNQHYEAQLDHHNIKGNVRTLQRRLKQTTFRGQRYKQAYVRKKISPANRRKRMSYGFEHRGKIIQDFWANIMFTNEAHIDPSAQEIGYILREAGTRTNPENIQERGQKTRSKELFFYHDEEPHVETPKPPPKPRKSKYKSDSDFQNRLIAWEAAKPKDQEVNPKGNSMTQKYYTENLLPWYDQAIKELSQRTGTNILLQEDGDPSHGHKSNGLAKRFKIKNHIQNLTHPPQSPDLNPIEACWNILKQRVRHKKWDSLEDLKRLLQEEWSRIRASTIDHYNWILDLVYPPTSDYDPPPPG